MSDNQDILNISELYGYNDADPPDISYAIRYHDIANHGGISQGVP